MFTDSVVLSLYFETPVHAAAGSVLGSIDMPIQRERTTQWPVLHAAELEAALRDLITHDAGEDAADKLLGGTQADAESSSMLSIGDARILLFPVRSSVAPFVWITCPAALSRLRRDLARTVGIELPPAPSVKSDEILTSSSWKHGDESLTLEDIVLKPRNGFDAAPLMKLLPASTGAYEGFDKEVLSSIGLVSDEAFSFLVRTATEVRSAGGPGADEAALAQQEVLPSDALFYVPIAGIAPAAKGRGKKKDSALQTLEKHLGSHLRIGQGEALGRGWARTGLLKAAEGGAQ